MASIVAGRIDSRPQARLGAGHFVIALVILTLGFFLIWPVLLLLINSFNAATDWFVEPRRWGVDHWQLAFEQPGVFVSLWNSVMIWGLSMAFSFPVGVAIAWALGRTQVPAGRWLEFAFWVSYMIPSIPTTISWITLLDPDIGLINVLLQKLPFVDHPPFNIFSVGGIVWANMMGHGIAIKVMLLTPAFRNMDSALEEAGRASGAGTLRTMFKVTLPLMMSPLVMVFSLQTLRIFSSFETEFLLGLPFGFYVYSTKIFSLVRDEIPNYGQATVLASVTLLLVLVIIPLQRWVLERRKYTTITSSFRPGMVDLGAWNWAIFGLIAVLVVLLTIGPLFVLLLGSFMTRIGYFALGFTLDHWIYVFNDSVFLKALNTTLIISSVTAIGSPFLFSIIAYILVRTALPGRTLLDLIIWGSGAIPGILSGLGLMWMFLGTPGLDVLFGTIWALILVVILQGNTTGVNMMKGAFVQIGAEMEEAARAAGAGWTRTYFQIWLPLLMPTLVLLAVFNFVLAAGATGNIILLASRDTLTLSLMALELSSIGVSNREAASIVSIIIMLLTIVVAVGVHALGLRFGVRHDVPGSPPVGPGRMPASGSKIGG